MSTEEIVPAPVRSRLLQGAQSLVHGFSTRIGGTSTAFSKGSPGMSGDLNLGYSEQDNRDHVRSNRMRWLQALGIEHHVFRYALLRQEHTALIHIIEDVNEAVDDFTLPGSRPGDGLLTDIPGVLLTVQTADCVPVLLADPVRHVVGAFHAGWRGTLSRIVEHGIHTMQERYGTLPKDILAAIGPSIGPESYVVSAELELQFSAQFDYADSLFRESGSQGQRRKLYLDLWEANGRQLLHAGVPAENVDVLALDTAAETTRFFSHRAEHGRTGRMMSSIGLHPDPANL